jgi:Flp pilus assembly protein TadD
MDNARFDEAEKEFAQALQLDSHFVLAHAYHGAMTPGDEGLKEVESAEVAARNLPEPERALIEATAALRHDDHTRANAEYARLTKLVPEDWHAHFLCGAELVVTQMYAEGRRSSRRRRH